MVWISFSTCKMDGGNQFSLIVDYGGENPSLSPNYPLTTNAHWLQEKKNIYLTGFKFSTASSSIFLGSLSASLPPKSSLNAPSPADLAPLVRNELFSPWPLSLLFHGKQRGVYTQQAPREPGTSLSARLSSHKTSHCPLCFAFRSTWSPQADSASPRRTWLPAIADPHSTPAPIKQQKAPNSNRFLCFPCKSYLR